MTLLHTTYSVGDASRCMDNVVLVLFCVVRSALMQVAIVCNLHLQLGGGTREELNSSRKGLLALELPERDNSSHAS